MCIIFTSENRESRPTEDEIMRSAKWNDDGAGIAWTANERVYFERDLTPKEVIKAMDIEGPMLIHFRMASSGGKDKTLIHPFPLEADILNDMTGSTPIGIFAHNGTIGEDEWKPLVIGAGMANMPCGPWSDSKALAYVISQYGGNHNFLELFDGWDKFAVMTPDNLYWYGRWNDLREGLRTSCAVPSSARTVYTGKGTGGATATHYKGKWDNRIEDELTGYGSWRGPAGYLTHDRGGFWMADETGEWVRRELPTSAAEIDAMTDEEWIAYQSATGEGDDDVPTIETLMSDADDKDMMSVETCGRPDAWGNPNEGSD